MISIRTIKIGVGHLLLICLGLFAGKKLSDLVKPYYCAYLYENLLMQYDKELPYCKEVLETSDVFFRNNKIESTQISVLIKEFETINRKKAQQ